MRFAITDNGIGIGIGMDRETVSRLCQPFVQGDTRTTRRYGGTGLRLAICRGLADLMSGRVTIDSEAGRGTTVSLTLPLASIEAGAAHTRWSVTHANAAG